MINDNNIAVEAKALNKVYKVKNKKDINALVNFDITIPRGITYGLLGPNGAGKSTFINILGGIVLKTSGLVKICGINIDKKTTDSRKLIGIVPQELNMDPFFTPFELLELQAGLYGVRKKDRNTEQILERVGLINQKNAYARNLSGGMRRRLLVAKALVHKPPVIILDEPTAGVDVELRQSLWKYIKELNSTGVTVLLTTHYLQEAEELCDYITIVNKGKVVANDTRNNLLKLISKKTVRFTLETKISEIPNNFYQYKADLDNNLLSITYDKKKDNLKDILDLLNINNIKFSDINTYEGDLEDVFLELTK